MNIAVSKRHVVVLGPIGTGKTTVLRDLLGITSQDIYPEKTEGAFSLVEHEGKARLTITDGIFLPDSVRYDHERQLREGKPVRHKHSPEDVSDKKHWLRHLTEYMRSRFDPFTLQLIFDGKASFIDKDFHIEQAIKKHTALPFELNPNGDEELIVDGFSRTFQKMEQTRMNPRNWVVSPGIYPPIDQYVLTELAIGGPTFSGVTLAEQLRKSIRNSDKPDEQRFPIQWLRDTAMVIAVKPPEDIEKRKALFLQVDEEMGNNPLFWQLYELGLASPPKGRNLNIFEMTLEYDFNKAGGMRELFEEVGVPKTEIHEIENNGTIDELLEQVTPIREKLITEFYEREQEIIKYWELHQEHYMRGKEG